MFEPTPKPVSTQPAGSSSPGVGAEGSDNGGVATVDDPEFPRLGVDQPVVNDLPSRRVEPTQQPADNPNDGTNITSATSSLEASDNSSDSNEAITSVSLSPAKKAGAATSKSKRNKHKGPAGFPSAEDLMHRLFLGISGVADQLQSNHAKEVRVILKHVFTVSQSEPDLPATLPGPMGRHTSYEVNALEPCTPEPQSPLIADSQSK